MDAQTVGGAGYDRWLIFQTGTRVQAHKKPGNGREMFLARLKDC
jgi:hypothetical protein